MNFEEQLKELQRQVTDACMQKMEEYCRAKIEDFLAENNIDLDKIKKTIDEVLSQAQTISKNNEDKTTTALKCGTVLIFGLIKKAQLGKSIKQLDKDDWKDLVMLIKDYALLKDGQAYTVFIFQMYDNFIYELCMLEKEFAPEELVNGIALIRHKLALFTETFEAGAISETEYIEQSLELCLEAMIKLGAGLTSLLIPEEITMFVDAVGGLVFQCGRYSLYKKEQELLTQYLENQEKLDDELKVKYDEYIEALKNRMNTFADLYGKAFDDDYETAFAGSMELAKELGVKEDQLLQSEKDVDDYFS